MSGLAREGRRGGQSPPPVRTLLADDHPLFLESLKGLLTTEGYEVVGTARNGLEALNLARSRRPELILMDIDMPTCNGLTATRLVKAEMPEVKIVMLTVSASDEHLFEAVKSGAIGYLLKSQNVDDFLATLANVCNGGAALQPELAARVLEEFVRQARQGEAAERPPREQLSERQTDVLMLVAQGMTYPQVGEVLRISEPTVRYHMAQIMDKLHLANRSQVIAYAARHGLIPSERG